MSSRVVKTNFWKDSLVDSFSPEDKYFWLYLLTNPQTNLLGVYQISVRVMSFEMGYSTEAVYVLIDRFTNKYNLIRYVDGEVAIKNYLRHGIVKGGKPVLDALTKAMKMVKHKELLLWVYENIEDKEDVIPSVKDCLKDYVDSVYVGARVINNSSIDDYDKANDIANVTVKANVKARIVNDTYHDTLHDTYHDTSGALQKKTVKEPVHKHGEYGWVKLTDKQYSKLLADLGEEELNRCIQYIDELAQSTTNKNKWSDWNLVIRRCSRESWGSRNSQTDGSKKSGSAYIDAIKNRYDPIDEWAAAYGGQQE